MANHKTGAQRYNDRKDKIFEHAREYARKTGRTSTWEGVDMRSEAMKKALDSKKLEVKPRGKPMTFSSSWKIWQHKDKPSEKVIHLKGNSERKSRTKIKAEDIPF